MIDLSKYQPQWIALSSINTQNKMFQFRKEITTESVANLAKSLAESGQKFPIVIWLRNSGEHVPVSGLRRIASRPKPQLGEDTGRDNTRIRGR